MTSLALETLPRTGAVGVVIPVNDEELLLAGALDAVKRSFDNLHDPTMQLHLVVVLDSCRDSSKLIAQRWKRRASKRSRTGITIVEFEGENVGQARATGCEILMDRFDTVELDRVWLATSDADTQVPPLWLRAQVEQHERGVDAWIGRVEVTEWPRHRRAVASRWQHAYDAELHPVHGANLGVNAQVYVDAGGFPPVRTSEDRALYEALVECGAVIHHDRATPVKTSARRDARAPLGFAAALSRFEIPIVAP